MRDLKRILDNLTSFQPDGSPVVSLYLRLMPEDRIDRRYLKTFKDLAKAHRQSIEERFGSQQVEEDLRKIENFLSEPENIKGSRGVAIFSSSKRDLWEVVHLPYVYRNRLMVSYVPLIREIAAIDEELGRVGVLLIDRKHVRFFLMDMVETAEMLDFLEPLATRSHRFHSGGALLKGAQGAMRYSIPSRGTPAYASAHAYGEYRFHMRIREEKHRLFKLANDALMEAWKENKFDKLVIGSERDDIREIENHLHTYLLERLVGYINVNVSTASPHEVREKVLDLLWQKDREEEAHLVKKLEDLVGKGLAVNGTSLVLEQLYMGNVKTLLVPEDFQKAGYFCPKSHIPVLNPECPMEDEKPYSLPDIVDEVIELALEERATVEIIVDPHLQKKIDGLAAFLRFSM